MSNGSILLEYENNFPLSLGNKFEPNISESTVFKMSVARISIFLARRATDASDDEITITPIMDDFKIIYRDGITKVVHFIYASENEVVAYVDDLFTLLQDDVVDPFKSIQFIFPCFPSVLYNISDINNNNIRPAVRDRLISVLRNWPETLRIGLLRSNAIGLTIEESSE